MKEWQKEKQATAQLFALAVHNPDRPKLCERVRGDAASLERRAAKFLTLATEYSERARYRKAMLAPEPPLATRLNRLSPATRQRPCVPTIPYAVDTLLDYIRAFERDNRLVGV
jgi:hypothetical protein